MNKLIIPLVACIACAILVSITAVTVRSDQNLNIANEKKVKILAAAGIQTDRVDEEFSKIKNYDKTLRICHSTVGIAILNTSITIVFGFSILVLSNFIPTIYFGIFTGIAMLLAMISVLTLLPSLLLVVKPFSIK